jgi:hypothetical protein
MKNPPMLLKVATVASAILLVSGYIAYPHAITWLTRGNVAPADSIQQAQPSRLADDDPQTFISSSKSFIVGRPGASQSGSQPTFISSSKSIILVPPDADKKSSQPVNTVAPPSAKKSDGKPDPKTDSPK